MTWHTYQLGDIISEYVFCAMSMSVYGLRLFLAYANENMATTVSLGLCRWYGSLLVPLMNKYFLTAAT